ncbi:MAG: hypothetical protein KC493_06955 [Bacteriovoracaceae bacterium]|nr:hypothetical protein [Bacteriovoracaceae bacterium]
MSSNTALSSSKKTPSVGDFTIQFYRIKINPGINVKNIFRKDSFFVIQGKSTNQKIVYFLSRNILKSKMLKSFNIVDSLVKFDDQNFKLFLKVDKFKSKKKSPFLTITERKFNKDNRELKISGRCFPMSRNVKIQVNQQQTSTKCRKNKWNKYLRLSKNSPNYVFLQIVNNKGHGYIDGFSLLD